MDRQHKIELAKGEIATRMRFLAPEAYSFEDCFWVEHMNGDRALYVKPQDVLLRGVVTPMGEWHIDIKINSPVWTTIVSSVGVNTWNPMMNYTPVEKACPSPEEDYWREHIAKPAWEAGSAVAESPLSAARGTFSSQGKEMSVTIESLGKALDAALRPMTAIRIRDIVRQEIEKARKTDMDNVTYNVHYNADEHDH